MNVIAEHVDKAKVFYLPSYSQELNPDRYLNCDLKAGVNNEKPASNKNNSRQKYFHICACCRKGRNEQSSILSINNQIYYVKAKLNDCLFNMKQRCPEK